MRLDPATTDGDAGMLVRRDENLLTVMGFGIDADGISPISILGDPDRLATLAVP